MSKSVVTAATAGRAKTLSRAKVLREKETNHKPAAEEAAAVAQHDAQATHLAPVHDDSAVHMSDVALTIAPTDSISLAGDFSFAGVMSEAADSAALTMGAAGAFTGTTSLMQDSSGGGGGLGGENLPLIIGGLVLVGGGIAIAASGGDDNSPTPTPTPTPTPNSPPTVAATQAVATDENTAKTFTVAATDPNGDTLTYSVGTAAKNGTVTAGTKAGDFTYTPKNAFDGADSFTITVSDGKGGTATQTVNVTVKDTVPNGANITISAAGSNADSASINTTYTVQLGNYAYSISGFGAGDKIVSPTGVPVSLNNSSFADGTVALEYASGGQVATITLTGLTAAQDAQLFGTSDLNKVFGAGTFA